MPYRLESGESIEAGIRRICAEQIERGIAEAEDAELDRHTAVHQVRKRCKKVRGALRLVRGGLEGDDTFATENAWFRDSAKRLSGIRDAAVLVQTHDRLIEQFEEALDPEVFEPLRGRLAARRKRIAEEGDGVERELRRLAARMKVARERLEDWSLSADGFEAVRPGLEKTYRRARKRFADAREEPSTEAFHEWRKRVKYHWYHCRLLRDLWPEVMSARRDEADRLADMLGDEHDLAVFRETLTAEAEALEAADTIDALLGLAARRRTVLRRRAEPLGRRLMVEVPEELSQRLGAFWSAWRAEPSGE